MNTIVVPGYAAKSATFPTMVVRSVLVMVTRIGSMPEHLESYLGQIAHGWGVNDQSHGIQIVSFRDQPETGVKTFSTLGLSDFELALPKGRTIRQELLVCAEDSFPQDQVAAFLLSFAEYVLKRKQALLRGEVVGPWQPIVPGATVNAVYATNPTPFPEGFSPFEGSIPPTILVLLVPLTSREASLVAQHGWNWFEDALEEQNPNVWNLKRADEVVFKS